MATAVSLIDGETTHLDIPGGVLEGMQIEPRLLQFHDTKFWGVAGVSRIYGEHGHRTIHIPVIIYDDSESEAFETARALADYIDYDLNTDAVGKNGTLTIVSESNHSPFADCTFEGFAPLDGVKHDEVGNLGGQYFVLGILRFTQLGSGAAEEVEE